MKEYLQHLDIEAFIKEPEARRFIKQNINNPEARFFINALLSKYPDFLEPKKTVVVKNNKED